MDPTPTRWGTVPSLLFSRRWWWSTLLVLLAMPVMTRLGFWQLERGAQRSARNRHVSQQLAADPLPLAGLDLSVDAQQLLFRAVTVRGEYDHTQQIILRGQKFRSQPGVNLITPLVLPTADRAVLVNRGWIPYDSATPAKLAQFDEPGPQLVRGRIRLSQLGPASAAAPQSAQRGWYRLDITALQTQMSYNLLPVYVQQQPDENGVNGFPQREPIDIELSDGSHLGYAIQWFLFVPLLGGGYLHFLRKNAALGQGETS